MEMVSSMKSLVVPGMAVTIALFSPRSLFNRLDFPTFGLPAITALTPSLYIFPSPYVRASRLSSSTMTVISSAAVGRLPSATSSSEKSMDVSRMARISMIALRSVSILPARSPLRRETARSSALSVCAMIVSATASACERSIRSLRKARSVNSPRFARRAPALMTSESTD